MRRILVYMSDVLSLRLPSEIKGRLDRLSAQTRRPASVYVREALEEYLDDLEDYYLAAQEAEDIRAGRSRTYPLEEVKADLGLEG
ncbi:MAG: ribbon-helix-helix protein, CopG family [Actinomycetaceae bacterium]|nr:ribbon-helix-helix protein, CopG family [Actinomycetaceae bacterium]